MASTSTSTSTSIYPSSSSSSSSYRPTSSSTSSTHTTPISLLPLTSTVPAQSHPQEAGPSPSPSPSPSASRSQRYLYFAVRSGHTPGVYLDWYDAERQFVNHPNPSVKTFSTRLAAEAFVTGWNGAGRHSLPPTTPRPLRDHLAMSFPGSVNAAYSPPRRQSYHARLLATAPPPSDDDTEFGTLTPRPRVDTDGRPGPRPTSASFRHSMVKVSSPLRQEVDEDSMEELDNDSSSRLPPLRKAASFMGMGGLLSPPTSPEEASKRLSVIDRERPTKSRGVGEAGQWSSRGHREFASGGLGLISPPNSPPSSAADRRHSINGKTSRPSPRVSGLWADAAPAPIAAPAANVSHIPGAEVFNDNTAPKFSRSGMKKSGIVMPVAAKRASSSNSLRGNANRTSLFSPGANSSSSSLASSSSKGSDKTIRRQSSRPGPTSTYSQDRLSSLAETSRRELQLTDEGLSALDSLSPPRPAFMRRTPSNSSIASSDSVGSMGSLTSASSQTSFESFGPIHEEAEREGDAGAQAREVEVEVEVMISCTKSDGDADGSVDSGSMKDVRMKKKGPGGMFKRFAKALKLEKKSDALRRGSL